VALPLAGLILAAVSVTVSRPPSPQKSGVPVARVIYGEGRLEQSAGRDSWRRVNEGVRVRTGDRLRTGPESTARVAFPWASVTVGPASVMAIPASIVLSAALQEGRLEQRGEGGDIIKLETAECLVRGRGRVVVRRQAAVTLVTVVEGRFRVEAGGQTLALSSGQGCRAKAGSPATLQLIEKLPAAPQGLTPGVDPFYVTTDTPLSLAWDGSAPAFHVQILPVGSDEILLARDVTTPSLRVQIPWLGTYRWRVSARDGQGLEGVPSVEGHLCVVEK
jgi:hypothetical protein